MILADKVKIIQDLQCKHGDWLLKYDKSLSYGICTKTWVDRNLMISNLIQVLYHYKPFEETVTNADTVTIDIDITDPLETYSIQIDYGVDNLVTFSGTGTQESVVSEIKDSINSTSGTHGYYCVAIDNVLYLYTYDGGASYSDTPTLTYSELNPTTVELLVSTAALTADDLEPILNTWNCLTLTQICDIVCKLKNLLTECNCN